MTTKEVMVTKYIACDNQEFTTRQECEAHEREEMNLLEHEVYKLYCDKRRLLYEINEARIKKRISWIDAQDEKFRMRSAKSKSKYCATMSTYWH